jgi:hypothetical protein
MSTLRVFRFPNLDKTTSQNLTSGALDYTTAYRHPVKLEAVYVKASVNITEQVTLSIDSKHGSTYDRVIRKLDFSASDSVRFEPDGDLYLSNGDQLRVQCTNANTTGTVYVEIKASEA